MCVGGWGQVGDTYRRRARKYGGGVTAIVQGIKDWKNGVSESAGILYRAMQCSNLAGQMSKEVSKEKEGKPGALGNKDKQVREGPPPRRLPPCLAALASFEHDAVAPPLASGAAELGRCPMLVLRERVRRLAIGSCPAHLVPKLPSSPPSPCTTAVVTDDGVPQGAIAATPEADASGAGGGVPGRGGGAAPSASADGDPPREASSSEPGAHGAGGVSEQDSAGAGHPHGAG